MATEKLLSVEPEVRIGVGVPAPLSARLDVLVERADQAGARTNRKELVAALILASTEAPDELAKLVHGFRTADAAEAAVEGEPASRVLRASAAKPGPRPRN